MVNTIWVSKILISGRRCGTGLVPKLYPKRISLQSCGNISYQLWLVYDQELEFCAISQDCIDLENFRIAKLVQTAKPKKNHFELELQDIWFASWFRCLPYFWNFTIFQTDSILWSNFHKKTTGRTLNMVPCFELFAFNVHKRIGDKDDNLELVSSVSKVYIVDDMIPFWSAKNFLRSQDTIIPLTLEVACFG